MIYAFEPKRKFKKEGLGEKKSIYDTVWYYFMPAFIEKESFRQIKV